MYCFILNVLYIEDGWNGPLIGAVVTYVLIKIKRRRSLPLGAELPLIVQIALKLIYRATYNPIQIKTFSILF